MLLEQQISAKIRELEAEIKTYKSLNESLTKERHAVAEAEERARTQRAEEDARLNARTVEWEKRRHAEERRLEKDKQALAQVGFSSHSPLSSCALSLSFPYISAIRTTVSL